MAAGRIVGRRDVGIEIPIKYSGTESENGSSDLERDRQTVRWRKTGNGTTRELGDKVIMGKKKEALLPRKKAINSLKQKHAQTCIAL